MSEFRQIGLMCPVETVERCRERLSNEAPSLAGLERELGPNSGSNITTHYAGLGSAPRNDIAALEDIAHETGMIWGYVGAGPEGETTYDDYQDLLGAFNLVPIVERGEGDLPPL